MAPDFNQIKPGSNYASVISVDPPVVLGWTGRLFRFGAASVLAPLFRRRRVTFLLIAKGSVADEAEARELADDAHPFMAKHAHHRFEWICNIDGETQLLRGFGLSAHTHNQNIFVREDVFRPVGSQRIGFDAVYNGRISPEKRNELAAAVPKVAFIAYRDPGEHTAEAFHAACRDLLLKVPGGVLLNTLTDTGCARLPPAEVNLAYAGSAVGLCLSPREGAMRVAVEYQMAGLPIVATPCRGGRDHYFDPQSWKIVPPDVLAIRDAVAEFRGLALPRFVVRSRLMQVIARDRLAFVSFVNEILAQEGGRPIFGDSFNRMLGSDRFEQWWDMRAFAADSWAAIGGDLG
ncbi:MAG: hypothetical protein ABL973_00455 [Micropepsaceae bacterium]